MQNTTLQPPTAWTGRVAAFVRSGDSGAAAIARFLPPQDDPDYGTTLAHLVKADLRCTWGKARSSAWADYRLHFPQLPPHEPEIYESPEQLSDTPPPARTLLPSALLHTNATQVNPVEVVELTPASRRMPKPGETLGNYQIEDELGRGAFGRVYLARERTLADRLVALKITRRPNRESQKLARLQHTNIVPIHSAFRLDEWYVVQMPYFGRQTLADLIEAVRAERTFPNVSSAVFSTVQMRGSTQRSAQTGSQHDLNNADSHEHPVPTELLATDQEKHPARELLAGMSYWEAAVWITARLADGLKHAHDKGILHLDLKPHNILLSDDGQPMLLDFNLSYDVSRAERDRIGGTWPYMAPEQICEYARRPGSPVDARSDLYALGVILFEMLTLRHPFLPVQTTDDGLDRAIEARRRGAPDVRKFNPNVPPSIAAVVAKLLHPVPAYRYQSAEQLREDLRRHADNRPLRYARDRSVRERLVKWHRRNPRLSLAVCAGILAVGLVFTSAQLMAWSRDRDRGLAEVQAAEFTSRQAALRLDLTSMIDSDRRRQAVKTAEFWLNTYGLMSGPDWVQRPTFRLLSKNQQANLRAAFGELALLAAHAEWLESRTASSAEPAQASAPATPAGAERFLHLARQLYGDNPPRALLVLERSLLLNPSTLPDAELSDHPVDLFARASRLIALSHYAEAVRLLQRLTLLQPDHFAGQFTLGLCYQMLGQPLQAIERFQIAKPLAPQDARPAFHRGVLLYLLNRAAEAEDDLTEALQRDPALPGVHLQRAFVRKKRGKLHDAVADLNKEINLPGGHKLQALVVRADLYERLGETDLAAADRETVQRMEPAKALEFVARGGLLLQTNPAAALADFERALKLDANCYAALQNKAHVYADLLQEPELALGMVRRALKLYPGMNKLRAGHAVLLARLGQREEAHAEAELALLLGSDPEVTYQAANVFALTARTHPEDRERSLALFRQCLREGFNRFELIRHDPDMAAVMEFPEFQRTLEAAMEMYR